MKKNFILAALVAVAAIFASCEKAPTAVEPENLNAKVTVTGYVRYQAYQKEGDKAIKAKDLSAVDAGSEVKVLRGTKVDGNMVYKEYTVYTDKDGFYTIDLGCAVGQVIDEVKVESGFFRNKGTYAYNEKNEPEETDAYFFASKSVTNLPANKAQSIDIVLVPVDMTSKPGMHL